MKSIILGLALSLTTIAAHAETEVCAGKSLYYSNVRVDVGTRPMPGFKMGALTIVAGGKVLVSQNYTTDTVPENANYAVELTNAKLVKKEGTMTNGSSISKKTAVLYKTNSADGSLEDEVSREEVVCQQSWRMAF